ncbi:5159_t:CDS:1 [Cetraspora pellucida]|uniref:5159_t:CDS:1 n=1 Tax=Cetraspora pellucida TaxID=1433469 RepID=A0A9N9P9E5_9GLOM|nr:5159_t:CDS:1 [Cetraspora pellucida]
MGKVLNNKLKQFVKKSKTKQKLIEKILGHDPDYAITNLNNIERLADIVYNIDGSKIKKCRKKNKQEKKEIKEKKPTKYQQFIKNNYDKVASKHENNIETIKAIAKMWKISPKNLKNGSGFSETI